MRDVAVLMCVWSGDDWRFVRQAIDSVLHQTYPSVDVHVAVDGPIGAGQEATLHGYANASDRMYLHRFPVNRGLAVSLNGLIQETWLQYRYYARMDADDISHPDRITRQVAFMTAHPGVDILGSFIVEVDAEGVELKRIRYPTEHASILRYFRKRNPMAHVTVMFRPSYFQKAGLYPPVRLEDELYWMQGFLGGCVFANLPEYLVTVRRSGDFLKRRSGIQKAFREFQIKWHINRRLGLGITAFAYAIVMFVVKALPPGMKNLLYQYLR